MEGVMRKFVLAASSAAAILMTGAMASSSEAMPLAAAGIRPAAEVINPVEKTACWRWGWHGWGLYPCGYRVWGPGYGWGQGAYWRSRHYYWGRPFYGYHHWRHWY
jgi:hypothetical protein